MLHQRNITDMDEITKHVILSNITILGSKYNEWHWKKQ